MFLSIQLPGLYLSIMDMLSQMITHNMYMVSLLVWSFYMYNIRLKKQKDTRLVPFQISDNSSFFMSFVKYCCSTAIFFWLQFVF